MSDLTGKVAIVTGSGRGVGQGIAQVLAERGADIVVVDIIPEMEETAATIRKGGRKALAVKCDITKIEDVTQMVKTALNEFGKVDILMNNAGGSARERSSLFHESTPEVWRFVIERNLFGTLNCCWVVVKHMMERGSGKIINMSSGAASGGSTMNHEYSAAKAGIVAFTKVLAREVANHGINVNVIAPGGVPTAGFRTYMLKTLGREDLPTPPPGLPSLGTPETVGGLVAFLASDEAQYISGQYYEMGVLR